MNRLQGKHFDLSVDQPDTLYTVTHALASPLRIRIMQALGRRSMNIGELAKELNEPSSSVALGVRILENAGLVHGEAQPGMRGAMKLCSRKIDTISVDLVPAEENYGSTLEMRMPIGGYSLAEHVVPTCGLAGKHNYIGDMDDVTSFYLTDRFSAQLIWFRQGALEYRFSFPHNADFIYDWVEVSFEACSEAPMYRDPWKSDICVSINGCRLGTWTSPCDCGGRRGRCTPSWWSDLSTQFGFLKTWRVDTEGSYLDNTRIGSTSLSDLSLTDAPFISVRIEVPADAENVGGLNLFGDQFGDFPQPIILRIGYHLHSFI